jgi:hypothetical protein
MKNRELIRKKMHFGQLKLSALFVIFILLPALPLYSEQSNGQSWKEKAQKEKLTQGAIEKLEQNGIVITDTAYKQIFTPYLEGGGRNSQISLFITTDSLINAYHVLYEESVLRLEKANAKKLDEILRFILTNLPKADNTLQGKPELVKAARERALIVVGTAMKLLDENYKLDDNNMEKIVSEEVEKVKQATAKEKPSWLGKPTSDLVEIDYSRNKPRGFYTSSEQLSKYFCAVSWLQSIPFRLSKDDELLSIWILGNCFDSKRFAGDSEKQQKYTDFFSTFKMLISTGDDWDVITAAGQINEGLILNLNENGLDKIRQKLVKKLESEGGSQINDQVRFPPLDSSSVAEPQFRFISAYRTPDSVLFQKTTDIREFSRDFPSGLEICVTLGSEFARNKLDYSDKAKLLKTIDNTKNMFSGDSLYLDYMACLSCLFDKPPVNSPFFMKNETWQAKSCNTVLAGWSQLRHTWSLQAKQNVTFAGDITPPAGFVEPNPEFYNRMALLAHKSTDILERAGVFEIDYSDISNDIMYIVQLAEKKGSRDAVSQEMMNLPEEERFRLEIGVNLLSRLKINDSIENRRTYSKEDVAKVRKIAQDLKEGKLPDDEDLQRRIKGYYFDLRSLWKSLENMSRTLEEISKKQLNGEDLNEYERFLKTYGINLAKIMFYNKNSYEGPKDDSMRIVDVHYKPSQFPGDFDGYLQVGIARPWAVYVLYPWQGSLVLCRGAVLPYYEFKSDSRLTDAEWKERLNSEQRPDVPEWIKPVIAESNLSLPSFVREANARAYNERMILEAAASQLNKKAEELNAEDFNQITEIKLSGPKLIDISGINRFHNLQKLQITGGNFDNINVIMLLRNLQNLEISNKKVSNIDALSRLEKLQWLNLNGTQVSDIRPLENLTNLKTLHLEGTQVNNIEPLAKLTKLVELHLDETQISDIEPLKNLKGIQTLTLSNTKVNSIGVLANLTNLHELRLNGTRVNDVRPLTNLTRLYNLSLYDTQVNDISPLLNLKNLKYLTLSELQISEKQVTELKKILPIVNHNPSWPFVRYDYK